MNRRGFTIVELLIVAVLMAIVGAALARMLISDSRFVARQDAMMDARQASRAALNTVSVELRMVSDSGLVAASAKSITVRVPYAFGMACRTPSAGTTIASLVPPDAMIYFIARPFGVAWASGQAKYNVFVTGINVATSTDTTSCRADSVRVLPRGRLVAITGIPATPGPPQPGTLIYLYQRITYSFAPSVILPGRTALWRHVSTGSPEELVTPFDTSSGFRFLTGSGMTGSTTPPSDLTTVRGIELVLTGQSQITPVGSARPPRFDLRAKIAFLNRVN